MEFIPVRWLRVQPGEVWRKLRREAELILTSSGRPIAVLVSTEGDVEETLAAVRRASRAQMAVSRLRETAAARGLDRLSEDATRAPREEP